MPDFLEEKYRLIFLLAQLTQFTLQDLEENLQGVFLPFDVSAVLYELIKGEFITTTYDETLVFNRETLDFDVQTTTVYTIIPEQREALQNYAAEIKRQRFLPDADGRPRSSNYRAAESLLRRVAAHPEEIEQEQEAIAQFLDLAQVDEILEQPDLRQREISEAYIRVLIGQLMEKKRLSEEAMMQFIMASQLFKKHRVGKMQGDTENRACEIFIRVFYPMYEEGKAKQSIEELIEVQRVVEKVEQTISRNNSQLLVFYSLLERTSDIERLVSRFRKQKIEQKKIKSDVYNQEKAKSLEWIRSKRHRPRMNIKEVLSISKER